MALVRFDIPRQRISPDPCVPLAQVSVFSRMRRGWLLLLLLTVGCGRGKLDLSSSSEDGVSVDTDDDEQPIVDAGPPPSEPSASVDVIDASIDVANPPIELGNDAGRPPTMDAGTPPCWEQGQQCPLGRPYCDFWGRCVECWSSVHCRGGEVCDEPRGKCVPGCYSDRDCSEIGQECDFDTNLCVQCTSSFHCSEIFGPSRSVCFDNWCQPCSEFLRCPGNLVCDRGSCVSFTGPPPSGGGMSSMDDPDDMMTPASGPTSGDGSPSEGDDPDSTSSTDDAGVDAGSANDASARRGPSGP